MNDSVPPTTAPFFQPVTLLVGVILGLAGLAWAGRTVAERNGHPGFFRFHPTLAPETHYQPTVGEMRAVIRTKCRPDQILVVVGGNSIFQGVGQPVEKLWSRHLQELLGDRYAVVNLAFRGSSPTDGGALAAESLRDEFPRQIYLANVPPFTTASPAGGMDYRFMLFDALHKGWLLPHPARRATLEDYLAHPEVYPAARELDLAGRLDAGLRFRDFWNWWSATRFFTFPTRLLPEASRAFLPRDTQPDNEPDFEAMPFADRFAERYHAIELQICRNTTAQFYNQERNGTWRINELELNQFRKNAGAAFPQQLKARTLIVLCRNSPYYTRQLTAAEQARDELALRDSVSGWKELGYWSAEYGPGFTDTDFGDRTHLTASGGHKLAERLAPEIRDLAARLGYLKP